MYTYSKFYLISAFFRRCPNYDLCEICERMSGEHHKLSNHVFIKIPFPLVPNVFGKTVPITGEYMHRLQTNDT